ncbi:MAG: FAD:protein FMN transferase, partial [Planctomycetota bacterium]|nr:FAD:protein FMN transferase [Planctomycetota bacterium]
RETQGAFDPTAGQMVALWRTCRRERRLPTESELEATRRSIGSSHIQLNSQLLTVRFDSPGIELNFNAMGKGYALDRAGELMEQWFESELRGQAGSEGGEPPMPRTAANSWLMHGGYSSLLARGSLAGVDGWPVAIRHPLLPGRTLATVWLKDRGLSTSGAGVQFFRHQGKRYGHIVDPRTGWPAEGMLSATVLAPDAATAEALSTAFFVLGVETARAYCHNHSEVAALLVPAPTSGGRVETIVCGLSDSELMFPLDH